MCCEEVRIQLMDVADGAEPSSELAGHLESCRACREQLEMLRRHRRLLRRVSAPSAPVGLRGRIEKEIDYSQGLRIRRLWWAAAAAVVLVAGTLTYLVLPGGDTEVPVTLVVSVDDVVPVTPVVPVDDMLVAEAPVNGEAVDYLVTRHAVLQNAFILTTLVNETEQNEYLTVAEGRP